MMPWKSDSRRGYDEVVDVEIVGVGEVEDPVDVAGQLVKRLRVLYPVVPGVAQNRLLVRRSDPQGVHDLLLGHAEFAAAVAGVVPLLAGVLALGEPLLVPENAELIPGRQLRRGCVEKRALPFGFCSTFI